MSLRLNASLFMLVAGLSFCWPAPGWLALAIGIFWALVPGNPWPQQSKKLMTYVLQLGVICLGAGISLHSVLVSGEASLLYTAIGVISTLILGCILTRWFALTRELGVLISAGTAICGGSAIAATALAIGASSSAISLAMLVVFSLNAVALFIFPTLGQLLGFSQTQFGLFSALAIHDTSSVVGAAMRYGPEALAVATTAKLTRMLWIIPVALLMRIFVRRADAGAGSAVPKIPWFIGGFLLISALATYLPQWAELASATYAFGKRSLVVALFLVGSTLKRDSLRSVGAKPLLYGITLWLVVIVATVLAIKADLVR